MLRTGRLLILSYQNSFVIAFNHVPFFNLYGRLQPDHLHLVMTAYSQLFIDQNAFIPLFADDRNASIPPFTDPCLQPTVYPSDN